MSDLLKRITSLISPLDETTESAITLSSSMPPSLFKFQKGLTDKSIDTFEKKEVQRILRQPTKNTHPFILKKTSP